jgi:hypothetical protein
MQCATSHERTFRYARDHQNRGDQIDDVERFFYRVVGDLCATIRAGLGHAADLVAALFAFQHCHVRSGVLRENYSLAAILAI